MLGNSDDSGGMAISENSTSRIDSHISLGRSIGVVCWLVVAAVNPVALGKYVGAVAWEREGYLGDRKCQRLHVECGPEEPAAAPGRGGFIHFYRNAC
jgi:hypothetical protein